MQDNPLVQKLIEKFNNSRYAAISLTLHIIIVAIFGGTVLFHAVSEPSDFEGEGGSFLAGDSVAAPPQPTQPLPQQDMNVTVMTPSPSMSNPIETITVNSAAPLDFQMDAITIPTITPTTPDSIQQQMTATPTQAPSDGLTAQQAQLIGDFTRGWGRGKGSGSGTGIRQREFEFVAYIGQYSGGDWNSTVRVVNNKIVSGSLPNLLWLISKWSKNKIKTNERNVKAIRLDSDEIFVTKPPFIFMTGTRDFKLTEKEVENLRKYLQMGGAIWGDSSVPGQRSRFDIAFRREMKRVLPDVDKDFEPLPSNHPIYTKGYYPKITSAPPGINYYNEPVYALKIYGEIAVIYTSNDYGDMWQIGLTEDGKVDLRRDERGNYVAINPALWEYRDVYVRNLEPEPLRTCFEFGTNVIVYLLTRWEDKIARAPKL